MLMTCDLPTACSRLLKLSQARGVSLTAKMEHDWGQAIYEVHNPSSNWTAGGGFSSSPFTVKTGFVHTGQSIQRQKCIITTVHYPWHRADTAAGRAL